MFMEFVGGGGNIAIATAMGCCAHIFYVVLSSITRSMGINNLLFYTCLRLRFLDVETNPGPRRPVPAVCRVLYSKVQGLSRNLSDLTVKSTQFDLLLCSETLVYDMRTVAGKLCKSWSKKTKSC